MIKAIASPKQHLSAFFYFLAFILFGLAWAILGPTLPGLAKQTNTQLDGISFLFIAASLGFTLGALLGGRLFDRFSGHRVFSFSLLLLSLVLLLIPTVPWLWALSILVFGIGWASGGIDVGGNTMLVWIYRQHVGPFMNGLHFAFGIGAFVAPLLVALSISLTGEFNWAFWSLALLPLPIVIFLIRLPSPKPIREKEDSSETDSFPHTLVGLIVAFLFLYGGAEIAFGNWIFTYATELNLLNDEWAAYLNAGFWGALMVGRLLGIPITMRFRPRHILWVDLIGCLISIGILMVWPQAHWALWVSALGLGLFMASIFPTTLTLLSRRMTITGKINSYIFSGAGVGTMLLPWLVGQWFERVSPQVMIYVVGVALLIMLVVLILFLKHSVNIEQKNLI